MAKFVALVKRADGSVYKAGDIVKLAKSGQEFGKAELSACYVVELGGTDFHDIWNIEASLDKDVMDTMPIGIMLNKRNFVANARMTSRKMLELARYRIGENGKVRDKKYD